MMQIPIGLEDKHQGVVDLVTMKAYYFEGEDGTEIVEREIPAELLDQAEERREIMLDAVSMFSEELMEAMLEEQVTEELIYDAVRQGTLSLELTPVFLGSAYKNKGIQPLLNAVLRYLPNPTEVQNKALDLDNNEEEVLLKADDHCSSRCPGLQTRGRAVRSAYLYPHLPGNDQEGSELYNVRNRKKFKVGRLIKMHADHMEDITEAHCGDIAALFGVDCASGDTFCQADLNYSMTSMYVPNR